MSAVRICVEQPTYTPLPNRRQTGHWQLPGIPDSAKQLQRAS
jgi:hypothetical protein